MPSPLYQTLYSHFRDAILQGDLAPNARLPSSRQLALQRGCSRNTVNQAYEMLVTEGYAESRPGSGTFVAPALPENFLSSRPAPHRSPPQPQSQPSQPPKELPRHFNTDPASNAHYKLPRPLTHGIPDLESFPRETWLKLYTRYIRKSAYSLTHYGHPQGYAPLRQAIAHYLNTHRGARCSAEQILIVSGSQHGLELVARTLLQTNDPLWLESPTYLGAHETFKRTGAKIYPVPIEDDGMNVPWAIDRLPPARLVYTTPSHQFPIGCTLSLAKRLALLEWSRQQRSWILEDDYDADFRYNGRPIPCMQGMPHSDRVLYLGTFSKSMFTDIRIGYLVLPPELMNDFVHTWANGAANPPIAMQAALAAFIEEGHYYRHIRRMRKRYAAKNQHLIDCIQKHLSSSFEIGPSDCGLHLAVYTQTEKEYQRLKKAAVEKDILLSQISKYDLIGDYPRGFVLGFSTYHEKTVEKTIKALAPS